MIFDALANNIFPVQQPEAGVQNFVTMKNYIFLPKISIHVLACFANKGFLFATSSQKIKSHVAESQITLLLGMSITYTFYFYKNQIILAEPQSSYCFSKF